MKKKSGKETHDKIDPEKEDNFVYFREMAILIPGGRTTINQLSPVSQNSNPVNT